ncbi:MAG TPA: MFS transporter [Mycobacteriales bacterium]|nr:MFS transporter [Mycobacteriales bacterium]
MAQGTGLAGYIRLLRHGPAVRPFGAAVVARLPISMAPLSMILLIQHVRGEYGIAGVVTGVYALGTATGSPIWGRCMDRFGQLRVIAPTALASAALLATLAIITDRNAGDPALLVCAALAGFCFPPVGPGMRAAWRIIFPDPASRRIGFALDASAVELIFVGGPLLLSLLLVVSPAIVPLLVTAGLLAVGGVSYSLSSAARSSRPLHDPNAAGSGKSAISAPGVLAVLAVNLVMSVGFGQCDTSLAATARQVLDNQSRLGILFAAIAGGSAIGGLWYGSRHWQGHEHRRLPISLGIFTVALVPLPILLVDRPPLWALLPFLFLAGLSIAPSLIMQQNILDGLAPPQRVNEAQALLTAAGTSGAAAGTAIAGILIDAGGPRVSFGGAAIAIGLAAMVALLSQRRWHTATRDESPLPVPS